MHKDTCIEIRFFKLYILFFLVCLTGMYTHLHLYEKLNLQFFWYIIYLASFILIILKFKQGLLFEPLFLLPSSYLFLIVFGTIFYHMIKGRTYNYDLLNLVGIGYLSLILGILLTQNYCYIFGTKKAKEIRGVYHQIRSRFVVNGFILISLCATVLLFVKGGIPLLSKNINEAKLKFFSGSGYLNVFFMGLTVFSLAMLYDACVTNTKKRFYYSNLLAIIIVIFLMITGYRAKTLIFIGEYISLFLFIKRRTLSFRWFIIFCFIIISFIVVIGAYRRGSIDATSIITETGIAVAARPAMFEMITRNFNESKYFYGTRYFYDLKKLLPGSQTGANIDLKYEIFSNADKMPELAGVTPSIIGEAYMNFGPTSIFWIMFILGVFIGLVYKHMKRKPSFMLCIFYFTLVFGMTGAVQSGVGTVMVHLIYKWIWILIIGFFYEKRVYFNSIEDKIL